MADRDDLAQVLAVPSVHHPMFCDCDVDVRCDGLMEQVEAILAAGWVGNAPAAEHGERDDLVAVVAGVFTAMHQHPRYCEAIADAIIAAGWKHVPDDLLISEGDT